MESPTPEVIYSVNQSNKKKLIISVIAILFIVFISALAVIYFGLVDFKKFFEPKDKLLVTVGSEKIHLSDVKKQAAREVLPSTINNDILKATLNKLIERKILELEAARLNINITDSDVKSQIDKKDRNLFEGYRYQLIRNKIIEKEVESRLAYTIGFWIPPYDYPEEFTKEEKNKFELQRQQGKRALKEAEERLRNEETPIDIGRTLYNKYTALQKILAVNGHILESTADETKLTQPNLYIFDERNSGQMFFDTLFSMKLNEIKVADPNNGSGGSVIKVVSVNQSSIRGYEQWLNMKKDQLVKVHNTI